MGFKTTNIQRVDGWPQRGKHAGRVSPAAAPFSYCSN